MRYASVQTAEKIPRAIQLIATGVAGHGSVPLQTNSVLKLSQAITAAATWRPPIQLNDTTRTYFTRLAAISPPADAARYRAVIGNDPKAAQDAVDYFAKSDPRFASMVRSSISPTIIQGGYRVNVIPSEAKATLDVRLMSGQDPEAFISEVRKVINDPAVRVEWIPRDVRPGTPSARLDSEVFKVLESALRAALRHDRAADDEHGRHRHGVSARERHSVLRRRSGARRRGRAERLRRPQRSGADSRKRAAQVRAFPLRSRAGSCTCTVIPSSVTTVASG